MIIDTLTQFLTDKGYTNIHAWTKPDEDNYIYLEPDGGETDKDSVENYYVYFKYTGTSTDKKSAFIQAKEIFDCLKKANGYKYNNVKLVNIEGTIPKHSLDSASRNEYYTTLKVTAKNAW